MNNTFCCDLNNEKLLREVKIKIGLVRIDIQKGVMVEVLLDSRATDLVISSEFTRKQRFKLKKMENLIYVRNVIKNTVKVNIYYQGHKEKTEIDIIRRQKWSVILGILQLAHHNSEINWRTGEVKMMRCPEKCEKQQRPKQRKLGW